MIETEMGTGSETERIGESCGVFGIYAPELPVAELTYQALMALQHRGQDGAGISVSNGHESVVSSNTGRVNIAFHHGNNLPNFLDGAYIATGHNRYTTAGVKSSQLKQALQPMVLGDNVNGSDKRFTLSHNGHVEDAAAVAEELGVDINGAVSDSEVIQRVVSEHYAGHQGTLAESLKATLPKFKGAYSLIMSTPDTIVAARDPQGFRPLHLGRLDNSGWVVASEIAALDIVGADPVREVAPGEIITIYGRETDATESLQFADPNPSLCGFEFVYFSRPDNEMYGEIVVEVRERMGALLAQRDTVEADMVLGVPESGVTAADGYSRQSGIPHKRRLIRNNYVDRSFIAPTQDERSQAVRNKLNPIGRLIKGQRLVVVDDSIVRATTQRELVGMLRKSGADEIHVRITSPPYKYPCYYGMDTGRADELAASRMTVNEICDYIGADSLLYLSEEDMKEALGQAAGKVCTACTTGIYPVAIRSKAL